MELSGLMNAGVLHGTSYSRIAAFNVDGITLCETLGIHGAISTHAKTEMSSDALRELKDQLQSEEMVLLVVDEVSTINTPIIGMINACLQQLRGNDKDFEGIAILFVGDFNQLGSVEKLFIPQVMMEWPAFQQQNSKAKKGLQQGKKLS